MADILNPVEKSLLEALDASRGLEPTPANIERLSTRFSPGVAAWAFTQWQLRIKAQDKFSRATEMLFVREALEQSTHERVSEYHASCFPGGALVADLTTGIGADLIALARRGPTLGYELDQERAEVAEHNLRVHGQWAKVRVQNCLEAEWGFEYAFADPARRLAGSRTLDPSHFSPNPRLLAEKMASIQLGGIKLSPMLADSYLQSLGPRIEFISFGGECREALVWCGKTAEGGHFAVHVASGERLSASPPPTAVLEPNEFLFDCDPAAVRAHCLGELCRRHGLSPLGNSNGYVTGNLLVGSPWLRAYRVLYHGKADSKATKQELRRLGSRTPEVKQRGAGLDVQALRKTYALKGERPLTLIIWPVGSSLRHTVCEPAKSP